MDKQRTIVREVIFKGIGLHTGNHCKVVFKPAPPNKGIFFFRDDLDSPKPVPATVDQVVDVVRGTTLGTDEQIRVQTVEHILSAIYALGVDNLEVHLSADEPPVGDGSAIPYVEILNNAGFVEQDIPRQYLSPQPLVIYQSGATRLVAVPAEELIIHCTVSYDHPLLKDQYASFVITPDTFRKEIAGARTFCFDYEVEALKKKGLARGGSLDNAVVIGMDRIHNKENMLRYPNEFVRHKILDLIGDVALTGKFLKAEIFAIRCGHGHNIAFARLLARQGVAQPSKGGDLPSAQLSQESVSRGDFPYPSGFPSGRRIEYEEIRKIIPHRFPFLLIDRVIVIEESRKAVGYKCVSGNESFFAGHFPEQPIMPGVLTVEAMAQTACVLFLSHPELKNKLAYFMAIEQVKFRRPVVPGDVLELRVEVLRARERGGRVRGEAFVGDKVVSEAEFMFSLVDRETK